MPCRQRPRVHRLLGRAQADALLLQLVHDVLEILQRAGEAVDTGDHERVAGLDEVEQRPQLVARCARMIQPAARQGLRPELEP